MLFIGEFLFKSFIFILFLIFLSTGAGAQTSVTSFNLEAQAIATSKGQLPFWFRARQGGSIPMSGFSGSVVGGFEKDYVRDRAKLFDWGIGLEGRLNGGQAGSELLLIQANAKVKLGVFELRGGRWRNEVGLADTLLSSGSFSVSGNALGVPQIQFSIPEFSPLPFTNQWVALKGSISHGWLGTQQLQSEMTHVPEVKSFYHHKSLYLRFGRPDSKLRLYGGVNHQAFWGNERKIFGPTFLLSDWQSYQSLLYGRNWAGSKVGNHLGTVDGGIDVNFYGSNLLLYKQFFYDAGGLAHLANVADGLYGFSLKNRNADRGDGYFRWSNILIEFLYTKSQGGSLSSKATPTGAEDYYNHYLYSKGWSYNGLDLGSPLITSVVDAKNGQASAAQYYINNRVVGFHGGLEGAYGQWKVRLFATFSRNYGTWKTSGEPYRTPFYGVSSGADTERFKPVNQFSAFLSIKRSLFRGNGESAKRRLSSYWGMDIGLDQGDLLNRSLGAMAKYGIGF